MSIKNRQFNHCFRKTKNKMIKCLAIKNSHLRDRKPVDSNNPILAYHTQPNLHLIEQKIELLLKNVPLISEQTLVFQSNFSQQTPPKLYDPLSKLRFGTYGIDFVKHGTISAKFIDSVRLNIARKLKKTARFWIRLCADTPVTARSAETRMGRGKVLLLLAKWLNRVKRICKVKP
jgi:hypothetical protein